MVRTKTKRMIIRRFCGRQTTTAPRRNLSPPRNIAVVLLLWCCLIGGAASQNSTTALPPPSTSSSGSPATTTPQPSSSSPVPQPTTVHTSIPFSDLQPTASSNPVILSILGGVSGLIILSAGGWLYHRIVHSPSEEVAVDRGGEEEGAIAEQQAPFLDDLVLGSDDGKEMLLIEDNEHFADLGLRQSEPVEDFGREDEPLSEERPKPSRGKRKGKGRAPVIEDDNE